MKKVFLKILKDNDLKITKNRLAILKELQKREVPTTAEDIYNAISTKDEKYSISSVYRALNQFCEKNIAKKTAEIDGTTYFQLNNGHIPVSYTHLLRRIDAHLRLEDHLW